MLFFQIHQPPQPDFVRRIFLRLDQRPLAAEVIHLDQYQPGFDARHIQRQHSGRMQIELPPFRHQRVPHFRRLIPGDPDFVAQIAGVSRARNIHRNARNLPLRKAKIFQVGDVRFGDLFQQPPGRRPLQRERRHFIRDVFDLHVQPQRVLVKPAHARIRRRPAIHIFAQPRNGPVVDYFSFFIAPAAVNHLAHGHLVDVARNHPVHQFRRVLAAQPVFVERRNVDHGRGVSNRVVFVVVVHFVHAHGVVARPFAIVHALAKLRSSLVDRGSYRHIRSCIPEECPANAEFLSARL